MLLHGVLLELVSSHFEVFCEIFLGCGNRRGGRSIDVLKPYVFAVDVETLRINLGNDIDAPHVAQRTALGAVGWEKGSHVTCVVPRDACLGYRLPLAAVAGEGVRPKCQ